MTIYLNHDGRWLKNLHMNAGAKKKLWDFIWQRWIILVALNITNVSLYKVLNLLLFLRPVAVAKEKLKMSQLIRGNGVNLCRQIEKHKLVRGHSVVPFCQVSLKSVHSVVAKKSKCLNQSEARVGIVDKLTKKHKLGSLVEDIEYLLPVKLCQNRFSGCRGEVEYGSANQRPGWPCSFADWPKNANLVEDIQYLLPFKFHQNPIFGF